MDSNMVCSDFEILRSGIIILFFVAEVSCNYPDYSCTKPCTRMKRTINYQKPICLADKDGRFIPESEDNCHGPFKEICPEFNKASCVWYNLSFPDPSSPARPIPCCRLKYYAKRYTWMEIYYTHQYGPVMEDIKVYDIVEVHRHIKNHGAFGMRDQADWPQSVIDPHGERGLSWVIVKNLTAPLPNPPAPSPLCAANETDKRCSEDIVNYLKLNYPSGFDRLQKPNMSLAEESCNANITIEYEPACMDILDGVEKTRACQVRYRRLSVHTYNSGARMGTMFYKTLTTCFTFLEVQVYYQKSSNGFVLKYGYWSNENPDMRDDIFQ